MRFPLLLRFLPLLPALLLARASWAQSEAEVSALRRRFPAARYGALLPQTATRSPRTEHRVWRPTTAGRWHWPATVRVSIATPSGRVLSVFADQLRPVPSAGRAPALPDTARGAVLAAEYLARVVPPGARRGATVRAREPVWYVADTLRAPERAGWLLTWGHPDSRVGAWEVVLDEATGAPAFPPRDLLTYHHAAAPDRCGRHWPPPARDTTAAVFVFRPDPLTTAQQPYGQPYVDSLDADLPVLNQQRALDTLWLTFAVDSFRLRNAGIALAEFDPPARRVAVARTPAGLRFGRAAAGFEQVNALFHLTRARQYAARLGYGTLLDRRIRVDVSGMSGLDQSRFSPIDTTLSYGEGGVDDAEDADVLVHEYLHALAFAAAPGTNVGLERRTLDEANADYWAVVHSARLGGPGAFGREQVFNWDGHNEFWAGRWVITPKLYLRDRVGNMYLDADIWSATLWQIRAALPEGVADRLFLQHLYSYAPNLTMPQAARLFLQADTLLYDGAHAAAIYQRFDDRHILGTHVVVATGGVSADGSAGQVFNTEAFARGEAATFRRAFAAELTLLSATGAVVWRGQARANREEPVPAATLVPGLYLLRWQPIGGFGSGATGAARLLRR